MHLPGMQGPRSLRDEGLAARGAAHSSPAYGGGGETVGLVLPTTPQGARKLVGSSLGVLERKGRRVAVTARASGPFPSQRGPGSVLRARAVLGGRLGGFLLPSGSSETPSPQCVVGGGGEDWRAWGGGDVRPARREGI